MNKLIKYSFIFLLFTRFYNFLIMKTSRVMEIYFIFSLINIAVNLRFHPLLASLATVIRFLFICGLLVALSEEKFWIEAKKSSAICSFFRRIAAA